MTATLSGYLGGFLIQDDNARVDVVFLHGGSQVGNPLTIGPVLAADRANRTTLLLRTASATVPSNADGARVTVTVTRAAGSADPQDNDGYADNLALTLDGTVPAPPHTSCLPDRDDDGFATDTDCDDGNPAIHPGAVEVPDDGIDQDCATGDDIDLDRDNDGYNRPQDCDDGNPAIHPGARDVPGNARDEDCEAAPLRIHCSRRRSPPRSTSRARPRSCWR